MWPLLAIARDRSSAFSELDKLLFARFSRFVKRLDFLYLDMLIPGKNCYLHSNTEILMLNKAFNHKFNKNLI